MPSATTISSQSSTGLRGPIPRDARLMALILASMGVSNVEPDVLLQLLEFAHRYTYDVLNDALVYADHASTRQGTSSVSLDDVTLATQSRVNYSFTSPPEKDTILALATSLNSVPLPPISDRHGVRLPPQQHCLTNVNFSIVPNPPPPDFDEFEEQEQEEESSSKVEQPAVLRPGPSGSSSNGHTILPQPSAATTTKMQRLVDDDDDYDDDDDEADEDTTALPATSATATVTDAQDAASKPASTGDADVSMAATDGPPSLPSQEQRGVKRSLDEDQDYD